MWLYEPDETPKRKHHWDGEYAGFDVFGGIRVGKCPRGMTVADAQKLLNEGVPWTPKGWTLPYPKRIYAVSDGVHYRAMHTVPGRSFHGFPEDPKAPFPPGRDLKEKILDLADRLGCRREVIRWMEW